MIPKIWPYQTWQLGLLASLYLIGVLGGISDPAFAQLKPIADNTLRTEKSVVTSIDEPNPLGIPFEAIEGGARRGVNLFHSFREFNVDEGRGAYFINPGGIDNILSRVTGKNPSDILGRLGVLSLGVRQGTVNLFLINSNGIIFGPTASLDVNGSFVATTANAVGLTNGDIFSVTSREEPLSSQLLNVNPNAFWFNQIAAKPVMTNSRRLIGFHPVSLKPIYEGLRVPDGQSLLLVGGNVKLEGGVLKAPGGRVELGGVSGEGTVELNGDGNNLSLKFSDGIARADISLTKEALVDVNSEGGGDIQVLGRRITLADGSQVKAITEGAKSGGTLTVDASESVRVSGVSANGETFSSLSTQVNAPNNRKATGDGGDLIIKTRRLTVEGGAQVSTGTFSEGQGGTLTVNVSDFIELSGTATLKSGKPSISGLFTQTQDTGDAGALTIGTKRLVVKDGAQVSASTLGEGRGGTLIVKNASSIELSGTSTSTPDPSGLFALTEGIGDAGALTIGTKRLVVKDGAVVTASALPKAQGKGGTLIVKASEFVEVSGTSIKKPKDRSGLFVGTRGTKAGGNLTIDTGDTGRLIVRDGAVVSAATSDQGTGGNIKVKSNSLSVLNGARIISLSEGQGDAGSISINLRDALQVSGGEISTSSAQSGGGKINITAQNVLLRNRGPITTSVSKGTGGGGDIKINTDLLVALQDSDITANAFEGRGGNIRIDTQGNFRTPDSDITARSELGIDGDVTINTPDVDPSQGLANLPTEPANTEIAQDCQGNGGKGTSRFINSGSGGLPTNPYEPLDSREILADVQPPTQWRSNSAGAARASMSSKMTSGRIVEAQGWSVNDKGEVVLVAEVPHDTSQRGCRLH